MQNSLGITTLYTDSFSLAPSLPPSLPSSLPSFLLSLSLTAQCGSGQTSQEATCRLAVGVAGTAAAGAGSPACLPSPGAPPRPLQKESHTIYLRAFWQGN